MRIINIDADLVIPQFNSPRLIQFTPYIVFDEKKRLNTRTQRTDETDSLALSDAQYLLLLELRQTAEEPTRVENPIYIGYL